MKKKLTILVFMLITTLSFSQSNYQDVVYLKNGSIIKGIIIEQVPNISIKIETSGGSIFVYKMEEIEKLTREQLEEKNNDSNTTIRAKSTIELGYQIASGDYGMDRLKLNFLSYYDVNDNFSIGFGTGLRYYFDAEALLLPILADFKVNFKSNTISPFLSLSMGYSLDATNGLEGVGFLLNPRLGFNFDTSGKSKLSVSVGYEMQKMDFYDYYYDVYSENSGAIGINLGLSF
tara:strand:+ start:6320 stop:7015 length:696 start_codon:yes stop_codon:yes gene_type:complete